MVFTGKLGAQTKFHMAVSRFASSWAAPVTAAALLALSFATDIPGLAVTSFVLAVVWGMSMTYLLGFVVANRTWATVTLALSTVILLWLVVIGINEGWDGPRRAVAAMLVGLLAGTIARQLWNSRQSGLQQRLEALPQWEADELGDASVEYRAGYHRPQTQTEHELLSNAAKIAAAVLRPLAGATLIESTNEERPVIAVYGTRVALIYNAEKPAQSAAPEATDELGDREVASERVEVIVEKQLPAGAKCAVFELDEGLTPPTPGRISVTAAEPHELAMFLAGGAPANGDALQGKASHVHHKNLVSLQHNGLYAGGL